MSKASNHVGLNAKEWDSRAETYDEKRFDYFRYMQKRLIALLPLEENLCILDIGCGTGWAVRRVDALLKHQGKFYGIDISSNMIAKANSQSQGYWSVHFNEANAEQLPFQANFFDLIICTNSFHHYSDPAQALSEIYRVLKSVGRIYILDVTADNFIVRILERGIKKREPAQVKFYSTKEYRALFTDANLEYIAAQSIMTPLKVHIGKKPVQG
jgi:ubiquinone/menaquinone biosynthesis C-methylase UbiE